MSKNTNEESAAKPEEGTAAAKPARKSAAAKKTTAKKTVAKKAAAKKTPAKKAAKKAVSAGLTEKPFDPPPVMETTPPKPEPASPPQADTGESTPYPSSPRESDAPPRFGRQPGGGPVTPREQTDGPPPTPQDRPQPHPQQREQNRDGQQNRESRSKKRRDKRKRRREQDRDQRHQRNDGQPPHRPHQDARPPHQDPDDRRGIQLSGPKIEADGMLELAPKGFGFLRVPSKKFEQARDDVFVSPDILRRYNLRLGQWIHGLYQDGPRGPQLVEVTQVNGMTPEDAAKLPHFDELKAINPTKRISFETTPERFTTRVVDIMAPVGRGQRGLIVSPPRSGKTTLLLHMAEAIREKYDEAIHLMILLVDERPEEVTEFRRALPGAEIYASSNDEQARNHCRIAELAIERAKRLVEAGKDVFLLMDSITRLARAYNGNMASGGGRNRATGSGGVMIGALEVPRRLFAAARNTRGGGSLTIIATALIQTNSRADEAIFMEFKGTGNMELVLDRKIAENYIYPAVDIFKSGTRREELLIPEHMLHKIHLIRRGLSGHRPVEAMERLLFFQKKFPNNPQMLLEIKG